MRPNKRLNALIAGVAAIALAPVAVTPAMAQSGSPEVEITQGVLRPLQIAVAPFSGPNGAEIAGVISSNLQRSGFFDPIDPNAFIQQNLSLANQPDFPQWTRIGAQAVLYGSATPQADGRVQVGFRLYDPYRECQLVGFSFTATPENWRRLAHKISDVVYQRLTGEQGYFDTRVVFVSESGTGLNRFSRLAVMDQDGFNPFFLTSGQEIILTPRFSNNPNEITYMALGDDYSRIYIMNLQTGRRESIGQFPGQVFAPRFSPDGNQIAFSVSVGGNTDVHVMDLRTRQTRRLTSDPGIDTSPSFSPDGNQIVFVSDRSGSARLYTMRSDGSGQRPISRGGGAYTAPSWSPRGDLIAFTKQQGGRFHIGVMDPSGGGERILSSSYFEEGPSWAPNGRYIMFARQAPGGGSRLWTVDVTGRVVGQASYSGMAGDPAWSPLLDPPPTNLGVGQASDSCPS
ncbi:MAG: Tol-Pal system beta propeller repeat protein TolB [Brevundimonas sp.]|uniref:Tol-Pal system beta propeller repeat protein TolB n=1 Tax=Brevundimonas sp. TaxID=1871086 RepID=UPI00391BFA48